MAKVLTEAHKAAMQAGRKTSQETKREADRLKRLAYSKWSKDNARVWMAWQENCGRLSIKTPDGWERCGCSYCLEYRASNSAMPDMRSVEGEKE